MAGASADVALALETLALKDKCSHCGKQETAALKRCSTCKHAWYCGAVCQNQAWKQHKALCAGLQDVIQHVNAASAAGNWRGVLKWEGRMAEMMEKQPDANCLSILQTFEHAHFSGFSSNNISHHQVATVALKEQIIEIMGKMQRFRDQGELMCSAAGFVMLGDDDNRHHIAKKNFQRARDVGAAHGFFSVECRACVGLGQMASLQGNHEEAADLLRNALAASALSEHAGDSRSMVVLTSLCDTLFKINALDEVEPLVQRYRDGAKELRAMNGCLNISDFDCLVSTAKLHEARGRPEEAAGEMRALLDLLRENTSDVHRIQTPVRSVLIGAITKLKILDRENGDMGLVEAVGLAIDQLCTG